MHHNSTDRKKHQGSTQESVHAVYTCVQWAILPQTHEPSGRGLHFPAALSRSYVVSRSFYSARKETVYLKNKPLKAVYPKIRRGLKNGLLDDRKTVF